jgi:nicotinamidase-related amidase
MDIRRSDRLLNKHIHPYVLCIIDMQPYGFSNSKIIIDNVLTLVREAIIKKAFVVVAQYKNAGNTHISIINALQDYPYKAYGWHNRNDKSPIIQNILREKKVFTRLIKVCGVNTEYCIWATVNGLARKYYIPIKVIESACNGTDRIIEVALHHMRTTYKNVEVIS